MEKAQRRFVFRLSKDKMKLTLDETFSEAGFSTLQEADQILQQMKIKGEIDLYKLADVITSNESVSGYLVGEGRLPQHGQDGYIEFAVDLSAKPKFLPDISDQEIKNINYKDAMKMEIVHDGDLVAKVFPPTSGTPGRDMEGRELPANVGKTLNVIPGEGTQQKENRIYATRTGYPRYKGGVFSVHNTLEVNQSVDLAYGNIKFPGTVFVHGDVLAGFEVDAGMDVRIYGKVEGGNIRARGNVEIYGGIVGVGKSVIKAGGNVECKFCERASIEAEGSVYVTKDLLHSQVRSLGEVSVQGGIIGGEIMSLMNVTASEIGNDMGTTTTITVNKHYRREKALEEQKSILLESNVILEDCRGWVRTRKVPDEKLKDLHNYIDVFSSMINRKKRVELVIEKFNKVIETLPISVVKVRKNLYHDVVIMSPHCTTRNMKLEKGPLMVKPNVDKGIMELQRG